jgi:hypothetical protein
MQIIGGQGFYTIDILDNDAAITQVCINELSPSNNSLSGSKIIMEMQMIG